MSSRGGSSNNGGGLKSIPAASKKMVQSLKEIVNCTEGEIYGMLKECNMDPNEAVNRLLSQDPFHEVKSKREKKKETRESTESKPRGASSTGGRGSKLGSERHVGHGGSTPFSSSEHGALHDKPAYKKENEVNLYIGAESGMATNNMNRRPPTPRNPVSTENKVMTAGTDDGCLSSSQPRGYPPAWSGPSGHISMADIVKMGRPHSKALNTINSSQYVNHHHVQASTSSVSHPNMHSSKYPITKVSEVDPEPGLGTGQLGSPDDDWSVASPDDDWPVIEQPPAASVPPVLEPATASVLHADISNFSTNRSNQLPQSQTDEMRLADTAIENINSNCTGSVSISCRKIDEDSTGSVSLFNKELYPDMGSYQLHGHPFKHQEAEDTDVHVSSVTTNFQCLSVEEDQGLQHEEENPAVIIPDHLQVQAADCLHLSFGSFGSGVSAAFSGSYSSGAGPLKNKLEDASADVGTSSVGHSDARNSEYYGDEPIRTAADENLGHRTGANAGSYESSSASEPEGLKEEDADAPHENQYTYPPSTSDHTFETAQQLNASFPHSPSSSQMQNLPPFSSAMPHMYNSLPNSLLASNVQATRESDLPYSPFPMTQSMPTKYGNALPSISGSTISMPEALKTIEFSSTQPAAQALPGNALPQHLAVHPYSHPTLTLGPFANMISYPFLPQSYTYMPSAFQQALAGNGPYHQSLAAVLPQYKNSVSVSSLPQSPAIASGYGGFGNSTSIPSNFPMNPPAASGATSMSYDDVIGSQYKNSNLLISLQQNENSPLWVHGPGSRTMSAVPANAYYNLPGQNQQPAGFRQTQQPSQSYGALGYPNFYPSQMEMSQEHQQQNPRDPLVGSQGQASKQSQQLWQNSY